jgi:hypothetical protein
MSDRSSQLAIGECTWQLTCTYIKQQLKEGINALLPERAIQTVNKGSLCLGLYSLAYLARLSP